MVIWTAYMRHRAQVRGFDPKTIEQIVQFAEERYFDTVTQRRVAIGRHGGRLVVIPYEQDGESFTPITVHATTRQQIAFRLRTGRFKP